MKATFSLCPTRKELVWVKNPPEKPAFKESIYGQGTYQVLLTQAIADAPVVKEGRDEILDEIYEQIISKEPLHLGTKEFELVNHIPKENTPYEIDIEGEMKIDFQISVDGGWMNVAEATYNHKHPSHEYRQVCRLIPKPKEEDDEGALSLADAVGHYRKTHPEGKGENDWNENGGYVYGPQLKALGNHGFWNGKPNELKTLVWKLDRDVWARVEAHECTQSWGRQESAKLILEYIETQTRK